MNRREFTLGVLAGAAALGLPFSARAQGQPLRIFVPFSAGSGSDDSARFYGDQIAKVLGRPVVVENRPGASGLLAVKALLAEPANGNAILLGSNSLVAVNPITVKNLGYDPFTDLAPLHGLAVSAPCFITGPDSGISSIKDLVGRYKESGQPIPIGHLD